MSNSTISVPDSSVFNAHHRRTRLLKLLLEIDQIHDFNPKTEVLQFEFDFLNSLYKKQDSYTNPKVFEDATYRHQMIEKLNIKIDVYRSEYFNHFDRATIRAEWYMKNGLELELINNDVKLQTLLLLHDEPPEVIVAIGHIIFRESPYQMYPPTDLNEMLDLYKKHCYHSNYMSYHDMKNINWHKLYLLHQLSVKHGHTLIAEYIYNCYKYNPDKIFEMWACYVALTGTLPDYAKRDFDFDTDGSFDWDFSLFKFYAMDCNIEKIRQLLRSTPLASEDFFHQMKILIQHGTFKGLYIYDMILQTMSDENKKICLDKHARELKMCNYPLAFEYLLDRSDKLPNQTAFHRYYHHNYHDNYDGYLMFQEAMTICHILENRGVEISYKLILLDLLERRMNQVSPSNNGYGLKRMLYYLQILDVMARRKGKMLNLVEIWTKMWSHAVRNKDFEICHWILNIARQRNIKFEAVDRILYSIEDFEMIFDLIHQYIDIFNFKNIHEITIVLFEDNYDFDKNRVHEFLQGLCNLMLVANIKLDFVKMFNMADLITCVGANAIDVAEWLEARILDQGLVPDYEQIINNDEIDESSSLKGWACMRIIQE